MTNSESKILTYWFLVNYNIIEFIDYMINELDYRHIISIDGIHRFVNNRSNEVVEFNQNSETAETWP